METRALDSEERSHVRSKNGNEYGQKGKRSFLSFLEGYFFFVYAGWSIGDVHPHAGMPIVVITIQPKVPNNRIAGIVVSLFPSFLLSPDFY